MFCVSPDGNRLCLMQQDLSTEFYTISVMEGREDALDPRSTATMEQARTYHHRSVAHGLHQRELSPLIEIAQGGLG